jgi:hypothetical protein
MLQNGYFNPQMQVPVVADPMAAFKKKPAYQ